MKLNKLLKNHYEKFSMKDENKLNVEIKKLSFNPYDVDVHTLFFCLRDEVGDINRELKVAQECGCKFAVVCKTVDNPLVQIQVASPRKSMAILSGEFYGNPAKQLKLLGWTGTNGKTTSTYIMKSILEHANHKTGLIGTNGYMIGDKKYPLDMTTPDPTQLHYIFKQMVDAGCEYCVMEVSAHAIYFDKIEGLKFKCGAFTNCTQDHLDFFRTMENYAYAKAKFFSSNYLENAVINKDDVLGRCLATISNVPKISTYGIKQGSDFQAKSIKLGLDGSQFCVDFGNEEKQLSFAIPGEYNVANVLSCVACANALGLPFEAIQSGVAILKNVDGRCQISTLPNGAKAVVDYAHTPDGVQNILKCLKPLTKGRLIAVFGCGGNRDKGKRAKMGRIASDMADFVVITSDNPRFENPDLIIDEISQGIPHSREDFVCITNRKKAIEFALKIAEPKDCIAILGKGAETYQDIKGRKYPFSDQEIIDDFCKCEQTTNIVNEK